MSSVDIRHIRKDQNHMATTFEFLVSCERARSLHAESVLDEAHALVQLLELELSEFLPASPIHQLNHAVPGVRVELTRAGIFLLERSLILSRQTQGAFDPSAKSSGPKGSLETRFAWSSETSEAWRLDAAARLGFGAIGKGYALDRVRELLEREGFGDYVLSAGGSSLILSGHAAPGTPWDFGWSWKKDADGAPLGLRLLHNGETVAIGVSGTHEKGQHILGSAISAPRQLKSALVALPGASAADADALSTALFVSGWEESSAIASRVAEDCAIPPAMACIDAEETPAWNGIFHRLWGSQIARVSSIAIAALGLLSTHARADEDAVDLGSMAGADSFTPYILERSNWWILLPAFVLVVVLVHLRSTKSPKKR